MRSAFRETFNSLFLAVVDSRQIQSRGNVALFKWSSEKKELGFPSFLFSNLSNPHKQHLISFWNECLGHVLSVQQNQPLTRLEPQQARCKYGWILATPSALIPALTRVFRFLTLLWIPKL